MALDDKKVSNAKLDIDDDENIWTEKSPSLPDSSVDLKNVKSNPEPLKTEKKSEELKPDLDQNQAGSKSIGKIYSKYKLSIFISALVILVISVASFFIFSTEQSKDEKVIEEKISETEQPAQEIEKKDETKISIDETKDKIKTSAILEYSLKPFMIKDLVKQPGSFINVAVTFSISDETVSAEMERNIVMIRDKLYTILSDTRFEDYLDNQKRQKLGIDLAIAVNMIIQEGFVSDTKFIQISRI